jgi:hypothetical protein
MSSHEGLSKRESKQQRTPAMAGFDSAQKITFAQIVYCGTVPLIYRGA